MTKPPENILAIDTATDILSVALRSPQGQWYADIDGGLHHSERLIPLIDTLLHQASWSRRDIHLVCCMEGPGSFTGLRIGFATAKGFSLALGIPYLSIPTLDCYAYAHRHWPGTVIPLMDAKKGCFFTALYHRGQLLTSYLDIEHGVLSLLLETHPEPYLLTGPDADRVFSYVQDRFPSSTVYLDPSYRYGKARELLEIARERYTLTLRGNSSCAGPLYLRKSDAELAQERYQNG